jgi:hypothetical protein
MEGTVNLETRAEANAGVALRAFPVRARLIDRASPAWVKGKNDA